MGTYQVTANGILTARLVRATFPPALWTTMVAIADAESTFNPSQINPASGATGLFQIEPAPVHPYSQTALLNPVTNTQAAYALWRQYGLQPWSGDGYSAFTGLAQTLVTETAPPPPVISQVQQAQGAVTLTPGGRVQARLTLRASGTVPAHYTVNTLLLASGTSLNVFSPNPVSGALTPGTTATLVQQSSALGIPTGDRRLAGAPPGIILRYGVQWQVTNTATGSRLTIASSASAVEVAE